VGIFYFGVAPDVMQHEGVNWKNTSALNPPSFAAPHGAAGHEAAGAGEEHAKEPAAGAVHDGH
jgi:hypothetical protein